MKTPLRDRLYFLRQQRGLEVDLLIDDPKGRLWVEFKNSGTFKTRMIDPMLEVVQKGERGFLVYRGTDFPYKGPVDIVNYREFLSKISLS